MSIKHSQVYKQKTEVAKKEYLKALAAYRASLVSKVSDFDVFTNKSEVVIILLCWFCYGVDT